MHNENYICTLADKWISGTITEKEKIIFNEWYNNFNYAELEINNENYFKEEVIREKIRASVKRDIVNFSSVPKTYQISRILAIAASLLFMLGVVLFFVSNRYQKNAAKSIHALTDVRPGKNTATLTLADGKKIILSQSTNGKLADQGGTDIIKTEDGQIQYNISSNLALDANEFNTLSTARGEQFQVILPDGTKVWLNAASTLRFPPRFVAGSERKVVLQGEAYFEVSPNKKQPFIVASNRQEVEVLGTHFNINSYDDEAITKTTLIEGAVRVKPIVHFSNKNVLDNTVTLKPGEQSSLYQNTISVSAINHESAIAWKNGFFMFNDESIESIMRKISRWYDVDIIYKGNIEANKFEGKISRYDDVSKVLKMLELTESIHFEIKERRILVMP